MRTRRCPRQSSAVGRVDVRVVLCWTVHVLYFDAVEMCSPVRMQNCVEPSGRAVVPSVRLCRVFCSSRARARARAGTRVLFHSFIQHRTMVVVLYRDIPVLSFDLRQGVAAGVEPTVVKELRPPRVCDRGHDVSSKPLGFQK